MESKHDKFVRLSKRRKDEISEQLRLIVNLKNKNFYEYSDTEVKQLFSELETMVKLAKKEFTTGKRFTL